MGITSINNKHIKEICRLKNKKYRDSCGLYIVETLHLVLEALKHGNVVEVIVCLGNDINTDVKKTFVNDYVMKKLSSTESNPKFIAVVKKTYNNEYGNKLVILDNIQDPGNLGAIIRSAVSFNIDTIILSDDCVDLYNPKVLRASEGMTFNINVIRTNLVSFINTIKKEDYLVLGTDVNDGIDVRDVDVPSKFAFVIGNEGNGITKEVRGLCDKNIYIKINNNCESLNASVAASIIMYELNNK